MKKGITLEDILVGAGIALSLVSLVVLLGFLSWYAAEEMSVQSITVTAVPLNHTQITKTIIIRKPITNVPYTIPLTIDVR